MDKTMPQAQPMCHIHFLKDALYLRPETEAVHKLLEGFPREIIWLESFGLEENREDCAEEMKKEACWLPTDFDPENTQVFLAASSLQQHSEDEHGRHSQIAAKLVFLCVPSSKQQEAPECNIADRQFDSV